MTALVEAFRNLLEDGRDTARFSLSDLRRARVLELGTLGLVAIGGLFLIQYWRLGLEQVFFALLVAILAALGNLALLRASGRVVLCGHLAVAILTAILVVSNWVSGGFYDPNFAWLYVVPLVAVFVIGPRALGIWWVVVAALTVAFWSLPPGQPPNLVPESMRPLQSLFNRLSALAALGVVAAAFVAGQRRVERRLAAANHELELEIASREEAEAAARRRESEYRDLVDGSPDLIAAHDGRGRLVSGNRALAALAGVADPEELKGLDLSRLLAGDAERQAREYFDLLARGGATSGVLTLASAGGGAREFEYRTSADGAAAPGVVRLFARDVTEQMRARRALHHRVAQEELIVSIAASFIHLSREDFAVVLGAALAEVGAFTEASRVWLALLDERGERFGETFEWRPGWLRERAAGVGSLPLAALPWLAEQLAGSTTVLVEDRDDFGPQGAAALARLLGEGTTTALLQPIPGSQGSVGLLLLESEEKGRRWAENDLLLAHILALIFGSAVVNARAEDGRQVLEERVQQAQKMESLGMLAGGIAHDFNNLLMAILGNASLALRSVAQGSAARDNLRQIEVTAQRAASLTHQMLAYAGKGERRLERLDVNAFLRENRELLAALVPKKVQLELDLTAGLPELVADPVQLQQVTINLVTNAAEAVGEGEGLITVRTGLADVADADLLRLTGSGDFEAGRYLMLEVIDTGAGMNPETRKRIFDPFFSTKFTGRGLGLAAVIGIVQGHSGAIDVDSQPGVGTRMRMLLPFLPARRERRPAIARARQRPAAAANGKLVLVIEDEEPVRSVLVEMLRHSGVESITAGDGQEGVELFERHAESLAAVLLDVSMPRLDGHEALAAIRRRDPAARVVLMSGHEQQEAAMGDDGRHATAFLQKPFDREALLSTLRGILGE